MSKEYFIFVEGQRVVVSKEVYQAYWHETNKENYRKQLDKENQLLFFSFVIQIMTETLKETSLMTVLMQKSWLKPNKELKI